MSIFNWIALFSAIISLGTFVWMIVGQRHEVKIDYVSQLEHRIEELEKELTNAEARLKDLENKNSSLLRENIELMRRLARINGFDEDRDYRAAKHD